MSVRSSNSGVLYAELAVTMNMLSKKQGIFPALGLVGVLGAGGFAASPFGCSSNTPVGPSGSNEPAPPPAGTGNVGFALTLPGGAQITSVTYDLLTSTGATVTLPSAPNPGVVSVTNSQAISFLLGGVPAATGDSITLSAGTSNGGTCQGSAS